MTVRFFSAVLLAGLLVQIAEPVQAQEVYSGELEEGDDTLMSQEYVDTYMAAAAEGDWLVVRMTSEEIDPYLIVKPPSCPNVGACDGQLDNDDIESGNTAAWIVVKAVEGGTWQILATSSIPGESGSYRLETEVLSGDHAFGDLGDLRIESGEARVEDGMLEDGDKRLRSGEYVDNIAFLGQAGESVSIDLTSSDFNPYLIFWLPDKSQQDNDDWEGSTSHSRIEAILPLDGLYRVSVTSFEPGESGRYRLEVHHQQPFDKPEDEDKSPSRSCPVKWLLFWTFLDDFEGSGFAIVGFETSIPSAVTWHVP